MKTTNNSSVITNASSVTTEQPTNASSVTTEQNTAISPLVNVDSLVKYASPSDTVTVFKSDVVNRYATAVKAIFSMTNDFANTNLRDACIVLSNITTDQLKAEDCKTYKDFAVKAGFPESLQKATISNYVRAGRIYASPTSPDALKRLTPAKLAELITVYKDEKYRKTVVDDATTGRFDGMTLKQLREYASTLRNRNSNSKTTVVTQYEVYVFDYNRRGDKWMDHDEAVITTEEEFIDGFGEDERKCLKCVSKADIDGRKARVYTYTNLKDYSPMTFVLKAYIAPAKAKEDTTIKLTMEQLIAKDYSGMTIQDAIDYIAKNGGFNYKKAYQLYVLATMDNDEEEEEEDEADREEREAAEAEAEAEREKYGLDTEEEDTEEEDTEEEDTEEEDTED